MLRLPVRAFSLLLLASHLLGGAARADVIVVSPGSQIQSAVTAAQDGDTILVKAGEYGPFLIDGKSLTVTADLGASVIVRDHMTVQNLNAKESVVLRGLDGTKPGSQAGLTVRNCLGPVLVEDCRFLGDLLAEPFFPSVGDVDGANIASAADLTLVRCEITGHPGWHKAPSASGLAARVTSSSVHLFDTAVRGGKGFTDLFPPPTSGGKGMLVGGASLVVASGSTIEGGEGSSTLGGGPCGNGNGGTGLEVTGVLSLVHLLDTLVAGGAGGSTGSGCLPGLDGAAIVAPAGVVNVLPGTARTMAVAHPLRELQTITFDVAGEPGDLAFLGLSLEQAPHFYAAFLGSLVPFWPLDFILPLGTVPGSGALQVPATLGQIAAEEELFFAQLLIVTATFELRVGTAQSIVLLDAAF